MLRMPFGSHLEDLVEGSTRSRDSRTVASASRTTWLIFFTPLPPASDPTDAMRVAVRIPGAMADPLTGYR